MNDTTKKRGRPPLSPEEKEQRRIAKNAATNAYHKKNGYASQEKYRQAHPEKYRAYRETARERTYEPKVRIPIELKVVLEELLKQTGLSISQLFIGAVEEKYNITLHKGIDDDENE